MKALNALTLVLLIVGGLNWGFVGLLDFDLVAAIFGAGSFMSRTVYVLVAASAVWQLVPLSASFSSQASTALRGSSVR